jgi:hypothetical protein
MLSEFEKKELLSASQSSSLRNDMRYVAEHRLNRLMVVDMDALFTFLNSYNEFINHQSKPFRPIVEKIMKL